MTRHGKNNTASSCYTYHERQLDTKDSGYGTQRRRLGKDSVKDFNACNLTLQACRIPVITPDGYLYDKESIFSYFIKQKHEIAKKMKQYEKDRTKEERELQELAQKEYNDKRDKFLQNEIKVVRDHSTSTSSNSVGSSISNMTNGNDKQLPSFWIPNLTPSTSKSLLKKPSSHVLCPMSGKPLKASHLIPITFTPVDPSVTDVKKAKYKCAVTHDILSNSSKCVVLKTSGSVVTQECVDKLIRKDMVDPINGKEMKESDIIPLQRGGTGYASTNELEAKLKKPAMMA
ncbi:hypothetical protein RDWZM_006775 [Blomia tropicalis]|uniref:Nitric oxide synthase-interacting protein homolog n=1 Tax=Blomia tropicalis TaxID=40697 RepID=A0A9Q0M957_BLOTA|nr:hypothetical protein BLOT_012657 [Blomia tropicalis]KAJ6220963.1 hypothetical protein RDWZM_006775 [Blomia tropicalis]